MPQRTKKQNSAGSRSKVAKEAASLLYSGLEKEYRQAKLKAAENLGVHVLPSNLEVALALDQIAEETEGPRRRERLVQMRIAALEVMLVLELYCPVLIGSVWRGNIRKGSDIDIEVYHDEPQVIVAALEERKLPMPKTEWVTVTERGELRRSFHIYAESSQGYTVEVVVRSLEEAGQKRTCDTFGDEIRGLTIRDLEKLLTTYPAGRFLPL
ncbi:MAG: nucleotidyltransferase domain-containing protein [Candidatus Bathyarchaeota archaeon]|nr:nucleotidyltransferase domain-containing protein [Candidatus Bathyarchaeota archaeon]